MSVNVKLKVLLTHQCTAVLYNDSFEQLSYHRTVRVFLHFVNKHVFNGDL